MRPLENWVYKDPGLRGKANHWVSSVGEMQRAIFFSIFLLTVVNLAHCQEWENLLFIKMEVLLEKQEAALVKQEAALSQLKGMQEKQEQVEGKLQEIQEKQEHVEGKLQEMQEKLQHVEINLQEMQKMLGSMENNLHSAVNNTQDSLQNISAKLETLEDIDECTEGKAECSPQATCRNFIGSYSCSCNPPFEGDGRTCEFPCESEARYIEGLGCVKFVGERKTFEEMKATCLQAGGRLLQDFTYERLQEVVRTFGLGYYGGWVGVREVKWLESGLPLQEELWTEGSRGSDPSRRRGLCGFIDWNHSSSSYKVGQRDCSERWYGCCQILIPQK